MKPLNENKILTVLLLLLALPTTYFTCIYFLEFNPDVGPPYDVSEPVFINTSLEKGLGLHFLGDNCNSRHFQ